MVRGSGCEAKECGCPRGRNYSAKNWLVSVKRFGSLYNFLMLFIKLADPTEVVSCLRIFIRIGIIDQKNIIQCIVLIIVILYEEQNS